MSEAPLSPRRAVSPEIAAAIRFEVRVALREQRAAKRKKARAGMRRPNPAPEDVALARRAAEVQGFTLERLSTRRRSAAYAEAREIAMYVMWVRSKLSYTAIGRLFNRYHSSVSNAIENCEDHGGHLRGHLADRAAAVLHQLEEPAED